MHKVLAVIRREFMTRVRSRAFVISTVLGPVFMILMFTMPILLDRRDTAPKQVAVLDGVQDGFGRLVATRLSAEMRDTVHQSRPRYMVQYVPTDAAHFTATRASPPRECASWAPPRSTESWSSPIPPWARGWSATSA